MNYFLIIIGLLLAVYYGYRAFTETKYVFLTGTCAVLWFLSALFRIISLL